MGNSPSTLSNTDIKEERNNLRGLCKYKNRFGEFKTLMDLKSRRHFLNRFIKMEEKLTGYEHDEIMKIYEKVNNRVTLDEKKEDLKKLKNSIKNQQDQIKNIQDTLNRQQLENKRYCG